MITEIILVITLLLPTAYALWDDRNGDKHPNRDWLIIGIAMFVCCVIVSVIDGRFGFLFNMLRSVSLSLGMYVLIFDWAVVLMLVSRDVIELKRGEKWYNHFSNTAWPDRWDWWRWLPWYGRLFVRLWIFTVLAIIYFCPCKIQAYENACMICR